MKYLYSRLASASMLMLLLTLITFSSSAQNISTVAGIGTSSFSGDGGLATVAELAQPVDVVRDGSGNVYICDQGNHRIRKLTYSTGIISTVAGSSTSGFSGDGSAATSAKLFYPSGIAVDGSGNIYIADQGNHRIRKVTAATGIISTIAGTGVSGFSGDGSAATAAQLANPVAVAVDGSGNVYISDQYNQRIRKITASSGTISTIAGTGTYSYSGDGGAATSATFQNPAGLSVDASGNIYVADLFNHVVRKITASTGVITTIAGSGAAGYSGDGATASSATLNYPTDVSFDDSGNIYIAVQYSHRIRKVSAATGYISTVIGTGTAGYGGDGSLATAALVNYPTGIASDGGGNLYVADRENHRIRFVCNYLVKPTVTSPVSYCVGATATALTATGTSLKWFTVRVGGIGTTAAPTPATTTAGTTKYYVASTSPYGCEGPRDSISVVVSDLPAAPTVTASVSYCVGAAASPLTAGGTGLKWYTTATGGAGTATAPTPSTTSAGITNYYVSQTSAATGCESARATISVVVNALAAAPAVTSPLAYCEGTAATALSASGTGLLWYTASGGGLGSSVAPVPATTSAGTTTYYVSQTTGCGESPRAAITVNVNAKPAVPTVSTPVAYCQYATATALTATGTGLKWYTASSGGAGTASVTPSTATAGTTVYYVSQTNASTGCESDRASITVNVSSAPATPGVTSPVNYCVGATASALTATGTSLNWYTVATGGTPATTAPTPATTASGTTIYYVSQSSAGGCEGLRASITVNVNALPAAPAVAATLSLCEGVAAPALSASGTGLLWYTAATGGTGSTTAPTPSTAATGTTTYYVSQTNAAGCEGPRALITVTVNTLPAAPAVTTPVTFCQYATATLLTASGTSLKWYITATGGTGSSTAPTPSTASAGSVIYYVSQTNASGCEGPRSAITVTINAAPATPAVTTPLVYCAGDAAPALTATGTGLLWYTVATGGTGSSTAPTPSTTSAGSTTYYVSQTSSGSCESTRAAITVTVNPLPVAPTAASPVNLCEGITASALTASGTALKWYTTATGGTGLTTAPTPSTVSTGTTMYYVSQTTSCGESARTAITVNVNPVPLAPTVVSPLTYCQGDTGVAALTASGTGLRWYTAATGGAGSTGAPTPSTATAGTFVYYVSQTNTYGCESPRSSITVKINVAPPAPLVASPVIYCVGATPVPLTATGTGLTWYTVPYGGTGTTTAPTPGTASPGSFTWYVSQTDTSSCPSLRAAITVTVYANPVAPTVTSPVNYCEGAATAALTASAAAGDTLKWYTTATGGTPGLTAPVPSSATVGTTTYYVSATSRYGCGEGTRSFIAVNINAKPSVPAVVSPVNYCVGEIATALSATGTGLKWYTTRTGGTATTTAPTPPTTTAGTFKRYVSQTNASGCESARDSITVTINANPATPSVSSPVVYCVGASASALTATGTSLKWYTVASGGTASTTAPVPATGSAGTTIHYVSQSSAAGCESPRAAITVNVTTGTSAPTAASPISYCAGATATPLTATGTSLLWYTGATGGTGSSTAPTPTTTTAHSDTFYVTQTVTSGGCGESPRTAIIVHVNTVPAAPVVPSATVEYCVGVPASVLSATGTTLKWYTVATGGAGSASAPTPGTGTAGLTTYYVSQTSAENCESPRSSIAVTVNALPAAPAVTGTLAYCVGATASALTATGTSLKWYTVATGGTASTSAPVPVTGTAGTTTYYVSQTNAALCEGPRATITVTINARPAAPIVTSPVSYCKDQAATAVTASGTSLLWYTTATGGVGSVTAPTPVTTATGSIKYYVSQTSAAGCEGARDSITVTVNPLPLAPTVSSATLSYCQGDTAAVLSATGTGLKWFTAATGGTGSTTAPTPSTVSAGVTSYYVAQTNTFGCEGPRISITVSVNPTPAAPTVSSPVEYCSNAIATALTATGTSLKWYTSATGGTGSTSAPVPGTASTGATSFYVTQTSGGGCESPRSEINVIVYATPTAPTVGFIVTLCHGGAAGALTATGSGLKWYSSATGGTGSTTPPTPSTTTTGPTYYYVSQTSSSGCEGPRAAILVNVDTLLAAPVVTSPVVYCQGAPASPLTASGSSLRWYKDSRTGPYTTTAPTPNTSVADTITYYVNRVSTAGCEGHQDSVIVYINPLPALPTVTSPVVYCAGATPGALSATGTDLKWYTVATGGTASATAPVPSATTAGTTTYYVSQTSAANCEGPRAAITVTVNAIPAAPAVSSPVSYCQDASASALTATGTGLKWYTVATGGTGSSTAPTPLTTVAGTTIYYVSQTNAAACEGPRASVSVQINPTPAKPIVVSPVTYCIGEATVPLTATGTSLKWYTTATGGSASTTAPTPSSATPSTNTYFVSQSSSFGCESLRDSIQVIVNTVLPAPVVSSPVNYCVGATTAALTATGSLLKWYTVATGGTASSAAPVPSSATAGTTTWYVSQTTASGCEGTRAAIVVNINTLPSTPTVTTPVSYCQAAVASALTAGGTSLKWYTTATGGAGSSTAPTPLTTVTGTTKYYVSQTNAATCEGPRDSITVTINPLPAAPLVTSPVLYCEGATATALTATGTSLKWYTTATGGAGSVTAPTPLTTTAGTTRYYVSQSNGFSCEGPRDSITVTVNPLPAAPTVTTPVNYCIGATAIALTATGTSLKWYTAATGGTGTTTAPVPATTTAGPTVYYVSQSSAANCEGPRADITVQVNALPAAPVVTTPVSYCQNAAATAVAATGTSLKWYSTATGGTGSTTAPTPVTTATGTTKYYVSQTNTAGCEGPRDSISVTINPLPAAPVVATPVSYCQGATASALTATGTSLKWYTTASGGTGSTAVPTPSTTSAGSTKYYVSQTNSFSCEGPRDSISVTINPLPAAPTVTTPVNYCTGATATALTASGTSLKWYTAATGGTGSTTAPVPSTATSGTTTYYVSQTNEYTCEGDRASIVVTINPLPAAPAVTSPVSYCEGAPATALTATGTSLKWYTIATGGTGSSTAPVPSTATAGSTVYYVSQTSGATCEGPRASITVVINALPAAPVVTTPVSYCQDAAATALTATGTSLKWYTAATGGTGSATAPTPVTGTAGTTVYYVSQTNTATCEGPRAAISVVVNPTPSAPVVVTPIGYCLGATAAPLTATGASLKWYTAATGGTGSAIAPTPTTTATGKTAYYVSQTSAGCESARALLEVEITDRPDVKIIPVGAPTYVYCKKDSVVLRAISSVTLSSYQWYKNGTLMAGETGSELKVFANGNYTVEVANSYGCMKDTTVYVFGDTLPEPTLTPVDLQFCPNVNIVLFCRPGHPRYKYEWYKDGVLMPAEVTDKITINIAGDYHIRVTDSFGCVTITNHSIATTYPAVPRPVIIRADPVLRLSRAYVRHQWYRNGKVITGATGVSYTMSFSGIYWCEVFDANGCAAMSDTVDTDNTTSIGNKGTKDRKLRIYPNPTQTKVWLEADFPVDVRVTDVAGRLILTRKDAAEIDLEPYADGVYIFTIMDGDGQVLGIEKIDKLSGSR
jgi:hypothetical protein